MSFDPLLLIVYYVFTFRYYLTKVSDLGRVG